MENDRKTNVLFEKHFSSRINAIALSCNGSCAAAVFGRHKKLCIIGTANGLYREFSVCGVDGARFRAMDFTDGYTDSSGRVEVLTVFCDLRGENGEDILWCRTFTVCGNDIGISDYRIYEEDMPEYPQSSEEDIAAKQLAEGILENAFDAKVDDDVTVCIAAEDKHLMVFVPDEGAAPDIPSISLDSCCPDIDDVDVDEYEDEDEDPVIPVRYDLPALGAKAEELKKTLSECVFGQKKAVGKFCDGWFSAELFAGSDGGYTKKKPRAVFTFAGPPGVGKTLLAEKASSLLGRPLLKIDMGGYTDRNSLGTLTGFAYTYINSNSGMLTEYVLQHPDAVLIFDEIEKAHPNIHKALLQMLDGAALEDQFYSSLSSDSIDTKEDKYPLSDEIRKKRDLYRAKGGKVSFEDTIVIFTTNLGHKLYDTDSPMKLSDISDQTVLNAIGKDKDPYTGEPYLPPEFVSRLSAGSVVMFEHLLPNDLIKIERSVFDNTSRKIRELYGVDISLGRDTADSAEKDSEALRVLTALLLSAGGRPDARRTEARVSGFIRDQLRKAVTFTDIKEGPKRVSFELPLDLADRRIQELFGSGQKTELLVYASERVTDEMRRRCPAVEIYRADSEVEAAAIAAKKDIRAALIDVYYSPAACAHASPENDTSSFGHSVYVKGARVFGSATRVISELSDKLPQLPVYLLEGTSAYDDITVRSYVDDGVRGVLSGPFTDSPEKPFETELIKLGSELYLCAAAEKLSRIQRTLFFNTRLRVNRSSGTISVILTDLALENSPRAEDMDTLVASYERPDVGFDDIIGSETAKKELRHIAAYMSDPARFRLKGYPAPTGVLLYGFPGTGKTMLAKACAGESEVSFIATQGSVLLNSGVKGVQSLFDTARRNAPCIVFIDEIDSVGKQRIGNETYRESVLNTLLAEMDGFSTDSSRPVVVIAATNADIGDGSGVTTLDEALARRFSKTIKIGLPDDADRRALLNFYTGGRLTEDELDTYSGLTIGFSPAAIKKCVMNALQEAIENGEELSGKHIDSAVSYSEGGEENTDISAEELLITARHEIGHTLCHIYTGYFPLYVTAVSRGGYGGFMAAAPESVRQLPSRRDLYNNILTALGGRAAEEYYSDDPDDITAGAAGDLGKATNIAKNIINRYGLGPDLFVAGETGRHPETVSFVRKLLDHYYELALNIIKANKELSDALVGELIEKRRLTRGQVKETVERIGFRRDIPIPDSRFGRSTEDK